MEVRIELKQMTLRVTYQNGFFDYVAQNKLIRQGAGVGAAQSITPSHVNRNMCSCREFGGEYGGRVQWNYLLLIHKMIVSRSLFQLKLCSNSKNNERYLQQQEQSFQQGHSAIFRLRRGQHYVGNGEVQDPEAVSMPGAQLIGISAGIINISLHPSIHLSLLFSLVVILALPS